MGESSRSAGAGPRIFFGIVGTRIRHMMPRSPVCRYHFSMCSASSANLRIWRLSLLRSRASRDVLSSDKLHTRFGARGKMVLLEDLEHFHFERPQVGVMFGNKAKTNCGRSDSLMKLDE